MAVHKFGSFQDFIDREPDFVSEAFKIFELTPQIERVKIPPNLLAIQIRFREMAFRHFVSSIDAINAFSDALKDIMINDLPAPIGEGYTQAEILNLIKNSYPVKIEYSKDSQTKFSIFNQQVKVLF